MRYLVAAKGNGPTISKHLYGHFTEHLGRCIYGGIFVSEKDKTDNVRGIRTDVVEALQHLRVPNIRWPGGCFADEYHWKDGVGRKETRKLMVNTNWGGVTEDNSFGTHEFMDLCEQVGCEPYINLNVGSGTVQECEEWVEYLTSGNVSPMTAWRKENGRAEPWNVRFLGIGNENWGCGGNMVPEYYADVYRRYATFVHRYGESKPFRIACGAGTGFHDRKVKWTETLMERAGGMMDGLSLHYYTVIGPDWEHKGSATGFSVEDYYRTLARAAYLDTLLTIHGAAMDKYDPEKRVSIVLDEWGTWFDVEPGTNPGFLYQQNTMRDALVAGISLNAMQAHADRLRVANIAQMVNVLQAIILTEGEKMVLTPTYHVFDLYKAHQEGTLLPALLSADMLETGDGQLSSVSQSASRDEQGNIHITLTNASLTDAASIALRLDGGRYAFADGQVVTGGMDDRNTFQDGNAVSCKPFSAVCAQGADQSGTEVVVTLPTCSVTRLTFAEQQA